MGQSLFISGIAVLQPGDDFSGRRALSRPRSLLHMRSCIRRLFSRKPEVLNPCQGDGASVDLYLLFLSRKVRTRRKASAAVASCAGLAPSCFSGDSGCCVLFWFLRAPRCHTAGQALSGRGFPPATRVIRPRFR